MEVPNEAMMMIGEVIQEQGGNMNDDDLLTLLDSAKIPKFPVETEDGQYKPKMEINETLDGAEISLVPEDLSGTYDYIADTKSMASSASEELQNAQQNAMEMLTGNPVVLQLLQAEGVQPSIKELLVSTLEGAGLRDAERFFPSNQGQIAAPGVPQPGGIPASVEQGGGLPADLTATLAAGDPSAMAQSAGLPQQGGIPGGVQPGLQ